MGITILGDKKMFATGGVLSREAYKSRLHKDFPSWPKPAPTDRAFQIMQYEVDAELLRIRIVKMKADLALVVETEAAIRGLIKLLSEQGK